MAGEHPPQDQRSSAERRRAKVDRWRAVVVSSALIVVVLSPLVRSPVIDSFPHSSYPMFSENRPPIADIELVVGIGANGADVTLTPELIAGTEEVIVAGSLVRSAVRNGEETTRELCRTVAARVATSNIGEVSHVEVRTDRFDAVAWFQGDRAQLSSTVHVACEVER